ncbi:cilia- and flagella-associated protein 69-like [Diprion similis]|uniref:cilia- and flagella-associated protein 69-like n=1 Tax=Diprion similis TaxID=362088 RepID=UPI001EF8FD9D|nr:cilia- and flagella-associated protein 69-like [Diprion similis]
MAGKGSNNLNQSPCDVSKLCRCPDLTRSKLKPLEGVGMNCRKKDLSSTIKKLVELVSDPVTSINTFRICQHLDDFISLNNKQAFYVKDLDDIMCILEFLALQAQHVAEYQKYLNEILDLCGMPPLLKKSSEGLFCVEVLEHYFTLFAYLLVILPTVPEIFMVHEAIHRLLGRKKVGHIATVKLDHCHRAVEGSILPVIMTEMLEIATDEILPRMLETTLLVVSISHKCCTFNGFSTILLLDQLLELSSSASGYRMMEAGVFEHILIRLDRNHATRPKHKPTPEIPENELGANCQPELVLLISNIIWTLLDSVMSPETLAKDINILVKPPSQSAMWSLRHAFKREVRCAGRNRSSVTLRNDLAAIMLAVLTTLPDWKFVQSGLAEDLVILAVATEFGTENTWASSVRLGNSNEDFRFKKILTLIMCYLSKIGASVEIMKQRRLMASILSSINPDVKGMNKLLSEIQFWDLHKYALYALAVLLPQMPEKFIEYRGTNRLLMILEWSMLKRCDSHNQLILNCMKTINAIILSDKEIIRKDFQDQEIIHFVLSVNVINSEHQRILTHAMMILEALIKNNKPYQTMYGEQGIKMVLRLLHRCFYDKTELRFEPDSR